MAMNAYVEVEIMKGNQEHVASALEADLLILIMDMMISACAWFVFRNDIYYARINQREQTSYTTLKAFLLFVGTIASFLIEPIIVVYLFDWLDIYSNIALVICGIVATAIPLVFIFKLAAKSGNVEREQRQKEEAETPKN